MNKDVTLGFTLGFALAAFLISLPISDASKYRKAIQECEKSLPRDQNCTVIGVIEPYVTTPNN